MNTSPLKIGYCLSLSGALASNGKTARLAHQIWQENASPTRRCAPPCCDVFHLKDGKPVSFHCCVAVPIAVGQLGVFRT
jgi:hypothetical protein